MSGEDDGFLARWARRKQAAKEAGADAQPPHLPDSRQIGLSPEGQGDELASEPEQPLPPIEELDASSDISAFLRKGVPEGLRRAALRRVWALDPAIRDFVGPAEYAWDFNDPNSIPGFSSSVGSMDLTGFFSGGAAPEDPATRLAQAGAKREGAPAELEAPSPETPTAMVRSDPAPSPSPDGEGESAAVVEAPADESSDTSPRRHGGALPH